MWTTRSKTCVTHSHCLITSISECHPSLKRVFLFPLSLSLPLHVKQVSRIFREHTIRAHFHSFFFFRPNTRERERERETGTNSTKRLVEVQQLLPKSAPTRHRGGRSPRATWRDPAWLQRHLCPAAQREGGGFDSS